MPPAPTWVSRPSGREASSPPTAAALVRDLRAALAGRVVVCVTHDDDLAAPGDRELRLGAHADLAGTGRRLGA